MERQFLREDSLKKHVCLFASSLASSSCTYQQCGSGGSLRFCTVIVGQVGCFQIFFPVSKERSLAVILSGRANVSYFLVDLKSRVAFFEIVYF